MHNDMILAINPGSTSTKVAAFRGNEVLFQENITHAAEELEQFPKVEDQLDYRREMILSAVVAHGLKIEDFDAFAGRGGGLVSCEGGVFAVNETMLAHASSGNYGGNHPARLGCMLAYALADGKPSFVVNGPDTDEFCDEARVTGLSDVFRASHVHALNHKEIGLQVAKEQGKIYGECNYIIGHLGGGVSIAAHKQGRMVDSNDTINGDGPMAPTRAGALPAKEFLDLCFTGTYTKSQIYTRVTKTGGLVDHLGTSDVREVKAMMEQGDAYAALIYRAFVYQIAKQIGAMAAVLEGEVDAIVLTGGISYDKELVAELTQKVGWIAPVIVRAGEAEMEALASGSLRVLRGEEQAKVYTGMPGFSGFDELKTASVEDLS